MLSYRGLHWLKRNGATLFRANIQPSVRTREAVYWWLAMQWFATGPEWRRVPWTKRPWVWLEVTGFQAPAGSWQGLEALDFWAFPDGEGDEQELERWHWRGAGFLDLTYFPGGGAKTFESVNLIGGHIWRVVKRDGRWLSVELALFADGSNVHEELENLPVSVAPGGEAADEEEAPQPGPEFWKKHAEFYCVEEVPFGTVTVQVPRNARDVESYAWNRARELIGVPEPEHIRVRDDARMPRNPKAKPLSPNLENDIFVELQFHGEYEE